MSSFLNQVNEMEGLNFEVDHIISDRIITGKYSIMKTIAGENVFPIRLKWSVRCTISFKNVINKREYKIKWRIKEFHWWNLQGKIWRRCEWC